MNDGRREKLRATWPVPGRGTGRDPRDGAVLHSTNEEPRSDRRWSRTPPKTSAAWTSRARCGTGACRWAACRNMRVDPRAGTPSKSTSRCSWTASATHWRKRQADRGKSPLRACFRRLRAQVSSNPVTGEAYLLLDVPQDPPPPMALGFTPDRPYVPSMPTLFRRYRIGCLRSWSARKRRCRPQGDRRQDSRQPRSERPVLHQRRANRSGERAPGAERRLAEVLRDDEHADRADRRRNGQADRRRGTFRQLVEETRGCDQCRRLPGARPSQRATRWTARASRRTISGVPCPPSGIPSNSCANSRGSSRSSRSRLSMVHDLPK